MTSLPSALGRGCGGLQSISGARVILYLALALPFCLRRSSAAAYHVIGALQSTFVWELGERSLRLPSVYNRVGTSDYAVLVNSFVSSAFHSWPGWSLVLFARFFCHVIDICVRCPLLNFCLSVNECWCLCTSMFLSSLNWFGAGLKGGIPRCDALCGSWIIETVFYRNLESASFLIGFIYLPPFGVSENLNSFNFLLCILSMLLVWLALVNEFSV